MSETRDNLISAALETMSVKGYAGSGVSEILSKAGVPKGSFYHFFKSKDELASTALEQYVSEFEAWSHEALNVDDAPSVMGVFFDYLGQIRARLDGPLGKWGCLLGVLGQELSGGGNNAELTQHTIRTGYDRWTKIWGDLFAKARANGELRADIDPDQLAHVVLDALEGAEIRMKVDGSPAAIDRLLAFLRVALKQD